MVVGMGDDPSIGEYERLMLSLKTTARKELVLLHPDRSVVPGSTREWLKVRFVSFMRYLHSSLPTRVVRGCINIFMLSCQYVDYIRSLFRGLMLYLGNQPFRRESTHPAPRSCGRRRTEEDEGQGPERDTEVSRRSGRPSATTPTPHQRLRTTCEEDMWEVHRRRSRGRWRTRYLPPGAYTPCCANDAR